MHSCSLLGSLLVDQIWHQHILDVVVVVVNYCNDMTFVGHNHDGALDVLTICGGRRTYCRY